MNTNTQHPDPDRIDQLMVDAATQGLSPAEEAELLAALDRDPALRDEAEAYELAATVAELALAQPDTTAPMPSELRDKILAEAPQYLPTAQAEETELRVVGTPGTSAQPEPPAKPSGFSFASAQAFGWYAAAAAAITLVVVIGQPGDPQPGPDPAPPTLAKQYEALSGEDATVTAVWGFNADGGDARFADAGGEIIWNSDQQTGYMKLTGMPANDPTQEQYQLWIVDGTRGDETTDRIDGGVFDVNDTGEVIVPIDAKLIARKAVVFAITVEQPGGVVTSKGPLQMVAVVATAG